MPEVADYSWPTDLPDGCPPSDAVPAGGRFYRFVNKATVTVKDFIRPVDRPNANFPAHELCAASALSLFEDAEDVRVAQSLVPGLKNKKVAVGDLSPEMGVIKNTPTLVGDKRLESHHDWWVSNDYTDLPSFAVVAT